MTSRKDMKAFESFIETQLKNDERCKHNTFIGHQCAACDREMMEDFVLFNLESLTENEIAQAINEGIITLRQVQTQLRVNAIWQE